MKTMKGTFWIGVMLAWDGGAWGGGSVGSRWTLGKYKGTKRAQFFTAQLGGAALGLCQPGGSSIMKWLVVALVCLQLLEAAVIK